MVNWTLSQAVLLRREKAIADVHQTAQTRWFGKDWVIYDWCGHTVVALFDDPHREHSFALWNITGTPSEEWERKVEVLRGYSQG